MKLLILQVSILNSKFYIPTPDRGIHARSARCDADISGVDLSPGLIAQELCGSVTHS